MTESDRYFFPVTTGSNRVYIDYQRLHDANKKWREMLETKAVRDQNSDICKMNCLGLLYKNDVAPIEILTLMGQFEGLQSKPNAIPLHLQSLIPYADTNRPAD